MIKPILDRRQFLATTIGSYVATQFPTLSLARSGSGEFELTAEKTRLPLHPGSNESSLWGFNGTVPGPELRASKGERIHIRFHNKLDEPTSIHWHGIRIDNAMDGVAGLTQKAIEPGESFDYDFFLPDAGTYWYHAHNQSWSQVGRGLYGPLIVDEPERPFDESHDITLIIDDWRLNRSGIFDEASFGSLMDWSHGGRLGNWVLVNGLASPEYALKSGELYRLRLINAANARVFELDPNRFNGSVLAYDGQTWPKPERLSYAPMLLGPAQRVDLLVKPERSFALEAYFQDRPLPIASFSVANTAVQTNGMPFISPNELPEPDLTDPKRVKVLMQGGAMGGSVEITYQGKRLRGRDYHRTKQVWAFNGVANLAEKPLFTVKRGQTVVIETNNQTDWLHAMHVHGHHFRILSRSESTVDEGKPWRDTFVIGPGQTTEVAFVADNPGRWLYHCHMLEHAAAGMNTWFEVI